MAKFSSRSRGSWASAARADEEKDKKGLHTKWTFTNDCLLLPLRGLLTQQGVLHWNQISCTRIWYHSEYAYPLPYWRIYIHRHTRTYIHFPQACREMVMRNLGNQTIPAQLDQQYIIATVWPDIPPAHNEGIVKRHTMKNEQPAFQPLQSHWQRVQHS